jgi:hypothetical protein
VNAVRWHHDPDFPDNAGAPVDIVHLANVLCQTNDVGCEDETCCDELSPAVIERLGLDVGQFEEIKSRVVQWVDELSEALTFN